MLKFFEYDVPPFEEGWTIMQRLRAIAQANSGKTIVFNDLRRMLSMGQHGQRVCKNVLSNVLGYTNGYEACHGVPHGFEKVSQGVFTSIL